MQVIASLLSAIFGQTMAAFIAIGIAERALVFAFTAMVMAAWLSIFALMSTLSYTLPDWLAVAFVTLLPTGTKVMISTLGSVEAAILALKAWSGLYYGKVSKVGPWREPGPWM